MQEVLGDDIGKQCGGWTITWQGSTGNTTKGTTIFSGLKAAMDKKGGTINYSANGVYADSTSKVDAQLWLSEKIHMLKAMEIEVRVN